MGLGAKTWELNYMLPTYPGAAGTAPGMGQSHLLPHMVQEEGTGIQQLGYVPLQTLPHSQETRLKRHPTPFA